MTSDLKSRIKQAVRDLEIDKPVMSCRVVGERIELHLLGGAVLSWPPPLELDQMEMAELRQLASQYRIRGRSKMDRAELIQAVRQHLPHSEDE